jgi:hypothetical protein
VTGEPGRHRSVKDFGKLVLKAFDKLDGLFILANPATVQSQALDSVPDFLDIGTRHFQQTVGSLFIPAFYPGVVLKEEKKYDDEGEYEKDKIKIFHLNQLKSR